MRANQLWPVVARLQEQYEWGHITKDAYLHKHAEIEERLALLVPAELKDDTLEKLARFLENVAEAWRQATDEQRNRLANALFEEVTVVHNRVVLVRPQKELAPFFRLSYEECQKLSLATPMGFRVATAS